MIQFGRNSTSNTCLFNTHTRNTYTHTHTCTTSPSCISSIIWIYFCMAPKTKSDCDSTNIKNKVYSIYQSPQSSRIQALQWGTPDMCMNAINDFKRQEDLMHVCNHFIKENLTHIRYHSIMSWYHQTLIQNDKKKTCRYFKLYKNMHAYCQFLYIIFFVLVSCFVLFIYVSQDFPLSP